MTIQHARAIPKLIWKFPCQKNIYFILLGRSHFSKFRFQGGVFLERDKVEVLYHCTNHPDFDVAFVEEQRPLH